MDPTHFLPRVTVGRIKAIQLEYSEARRTMTNALRKAPQHTAVGFKQTVSREQALWGVWYLLDPQGSCLRVGPCRDS